MFSTVRRIFKHRWFDSRAAKRALSHAALTRLAERISLSEQRHTGEIRIAVEAGLPLSYLRRRASARERAITLFGKLRVWDTADNNGVLVYLLLAEHAIEIVADRGLHAALPADFWNALLQQIRPILVAGAYESALLQAIERIDLALSQHFPLPEGQARSNQLPDTPTLL